MDEILHLAKRLADYCRMTSETGGLKPDSPIGIAYRDFIEEWDKRHLPTKSSEPDEVCPFCDCVAINEMGHCEGCGKLTKPPPA